MVEKIVCAPTPVKPFDRELDFAWDVQVLAPQRKGPLGTYALNIHLQRLRQRLLGNAPPEVTPDGKAPKPLIGDRVIWTKNDYELDLFNGTQAIVTNLLKGGAMELFTEDGTEVKIPPSKRLNVDVAYAMTIHKAQGSEWPCILMVASSAHWIMHDRNLLYTGASRASEALTILGDVHGIRHFASEQKSAVRKTFGALLAGGWTPSETRTYSNG
jgi:exodeoxyribonuclease V alpha subunit